MARANEFQREVGSLLEKNFSITYRIPDASQNRFGGYQVLQKPFDFFGATDAGYFWGAEVKRVKQRRLNIKNALEDHQRVELDRVQRSSGNAWIFINWRTPEVGGGQTGKAVWVTYARFKLVEIGVLAEGIKSLVPEDFNDAWSLVRVTGGWAIPIMHPIYATVC